MFMKIYINEIKQLYNKLYIFLIIDIINILNMPLWSLSECNYLNI